MLLTDLNLNGAVETKILFDVATNNKNPDERIKNMRLNSIAYVRQPDTDFVIVDVSLHDGKKSRYYRQFCSKFGADLCPWYEIIIKEK